MKNSPPSETEGQTLWTACGHRFEIRNGRRLWLSKPPLNYDGELRLQKGLEPPPERR